ncbi:MAG: hypothetical protein C5B49_04370 [Bdellovibrio sp.]|nr:MAG: hypothetical protein C5B49_04370 [Bdellovibrio sp.]
MEGLTFYAGETKTVSVVLTVPNAVTTGIYQVNVSLVSSDSNTTYMSQTAASAVDIAGGSATGPTIGSGSADSVSAVSSVNSVTTQAITTTVTATVFSASARQNTTVFMQIVDGNYNVYGLSQQMTLNFAAGETKTLTTTIVTNSPIPPGTYYVSVGFVASDWTPIAYADRAVAIPVTP